jgi:hypothetical protein
MMFVGCDIGNDSVSNYDPSDRGSINGTWYSYGNVYRYDFYYGDYEHYYNGNPYRKGTYTTTNNSMTMVITHIGGYYMSSYTWLESSTWYSRDEFKQAYLNYYRAMYRSQLQQTYDTYVANYGVATANTYFQSAYGTTNIDSIANSMVAQSQIGNSIDNSINSIFPAPSTVAYSFDGNALILGGVSLTRD